MNKLVGIINLEASNASSVMRAVKFVGQNAVLINDDKNLSAYSHVILPGVSSFGAVITELKAKKLFQPVQDLYNTTTQVLGLCAGFQIMGSDSEESPEVLGLNWFKFSCIALKNDHGGKLFHTGWNSVNFIESNYLSSKEFSVNYYFNHSYFVSCEHKNSGIIGVTQFYDQEIISVFHHENIVGLQFHPEKSQSNGLRIIKSFLNGF